MDELCFVIRRTPYGTVAAAEGVRHLIGAAQRGLSACAVLVDDGVYLGKQGHDPGGTGWTGLSGPLGQVVSPAATAHQLRFASTSIARRQRPADWITSPSFLEYSGSTIRNSRRSSRRQRHSSSSEWRKSQWTGHSL